MDFQSSPFERLACFYVTIRGILNVCNILIFWKMKTFFKKLEYPFLVESFQNENVSLLYKTAISEANLKTHRTVSTKFTYHKVFPVTTLFFRNILFQFKNLLYRVDLMYQLSILHQFCKRWSFIRRYFFLVSILKEIYNPVAVIIVYLFRLLIY